MHQEMVVSLAAAFFHQSHLLSHGRYKKTAKEVPLERLQKVSRSAKSTL